ncbi:hypothetical protein NDA11_002072 [Ustilago hordei]|uniref:Uncharacterized protein n=1 Tax=Ustilago hordei TaxID=120017 RepID=I2FZJ1_USTHO|nr:hypothetical protein NDA15_004445 [Ustilago hordei]KAJ1578508.1 hypothetical protein NDA12_000838 [Ustilago hordei]KAJ1584000.1 hypothetical protein NDA11_002072 [Ustilago hordei]KAJ1599153.1 hypothetical protein NDA14_002873 [Ustilago hordei]CCF52334.1 uncharacterized protein UHOR_15449 [Ustilago hordei]
MRRKGLLAWLLMQQQILPPLLTVLYISGHVISNSLDTQKCIQDFCIIFSNHLLAITWMYAVKSNEICFQLQSQVILILRNSLIGLLSSVPHFTIISTLVQFTSSLLGDAINMSSTYAVMTMICFPEPLMYKQGVLGMQ